MTQRTALAETAKRVNPLRGRGLSDQAGWAVVTTVQDSVSCVHRSVAARLQRDVPVLPRRVLVALVAQHGEGGDQLPAREARLDDLVDVPALGRDVRVGELVPVLG